MAVGSHSVRIRADALPSPSLVCIVYIDCPWAWWGGHTANSLTHPLTRDAGCSADTKPAREDLSGPARQSMAHTQPMHAHPFSGPTMALFESDERGARLHTGQTSKRERKGGGARVCAEQITSVALRARYRSTEQTWEAMVVVVGFSFRQLNWTPDRASTSSCANVPRPFQRPVKIQAGHNVGERR